MATAEPKQAGGSLSVRNLCVGYGAVQALSEVSFEVAPGEVLAVLGSNGAGKSTLGRAVSGLVPATSGHVVFDGTDVSRWSPHRIRRVGLVYIPEGRGIFPGLTVQDNLRMAALQMKGSRQREEAFSRATDLFPILGSRRKQMAGSLSGGEQQMLSMARALLVDPRLIIADEMSLGLAPLMVEQVFASLEVAKQSGIAVVLIEQFVQRALEFSHSCLILSRGIVGWRGPAELAGAEVLKQYLD